MPTNKIKTKVKLLRPLLMFNSKPLGLIWWGTGYFVQNEKILSYMVTAKGGVFRSTFSKQVTPAFIPVFTVWEISIARLPLNWLTQKCWKFYAKALKTTSFKKPNCKRSTDEKNVSGWQEFYYNSVILKRKVIGTPSLPAIWKTGNCRASLTSASLILRSAPRQT